MRKEKEEKTTIEGDEKGAKEGNNRVIQFVLVRTNMVCLNVQASIMHMCVCMFKVYTLSFRL